MVLVHQKVDEHDKKGILPSYAFDEITNTMQAFCGKHFNEGTANYSSSASLCGSGKGFFIADAKTYYFHLKYIYFIYLNTLLTKMD
jgi:hypothetical protein